MAPTKGKKKGQGQLWYLGFFANLAFTVAVLSIIRSTRTGIILYHTEEGEQSWQVAPPWPKRRIGQAELATLLNTSFEGWALNPIVLEVLASKNLLSSTFLEILEAHDDSTTEVSRLHRQYGRPVDGRMWTRNHTEFLVEQLLVTEALGGHHPHCNIHSQNRNLMYALLTFAGTLQPANEAVRAMGRIIGTYDFAHSSPSSYQLQGLSVEEAAAAKVRAVLELRGAGLSVMKKSYSSSWVHRVIEQLQNQTFTNRESGRTVPGFSPEVVLKRGWEGTFMLDDLQAGFDIPEVQAIAYDTFLLDVLQELMGVPPVLRTVDFMFSVSFAANNASQKESGFSTWHKDFNSIRSVKVFVYLNDVLDEAHGPHTYIPYTHNAMGPRGSLLTEDFAQSLSAQNIPRQYIDSALYTEKILKLYGKAGTLWMEDTHIFHRADIADRGWRGILQLDFTASGYCGKDHRAQYSPRTFVASCVGYRLVFCP